MVNELTKGKVFHCYDEDIDSFDVEDVRLAVEELKKRIKYNVYECQEDICDDVDDVFSGVKE